MLLLISRVPVGTAGQTTYDLRLVAGTQYILDLEGVTAGLTNPLADPVLSIGRDGVPAIIATDDDGGAGLASRIVFVPGETAEYTLIVSGAGVGGGGFRLRVEEDDFRNTIEGIGPAGAVTNGAGFGQVDYRNDADVFATPMIAGLSYVVELLGAASGAGSLQDPTVGVYRPDLSLAASNAGDNTDARVVVRALVTGTHYVEAQSRDGGTYIVAVDAGRGGSGRDRVTGTGEGDAIDGRGGDDVIRGGLGADRLLGGDDADVLMGQRGEDWLQGGDGRDRLRGGDDADMLRGGRGADTLIGGAGKDVFFWDDRDLDRTRDLLRPDSTAPAFDNPGGLTDNGDLFDLGAIDANRRIDGDQAFRLGGDGTGGLSLVDVRGDTMLRGNVDGDRDYELLVLIDDGSIRARDYSASDFYL